MIYIRIVFALFLIAIVAFFVFDMVKLYAATPGSTWDRILAAGRGSATIVWGRFVAIVAAAIGLLPDAADLFGDPSLGDAIKAALNPQYVAAFTIGIALISIFARRRTLKS